jgi:hypothetical protein
LFVFVFCLFFFHLFHHFYIYLHVYTLFQPPPISPPTHTTTASRQNLFQPLLWFCWRENIGDNKKDIVVLLVWDKDR